MGTFVASTIWEVFVEYKEVVSINDQIVTTWGGAVMGEGFYQLSDMLLYKEGWIPTAFSWVFNPAGTVRRWSGFGQPSFFKREQSNDEFSVYTGLLMSQKDSREDDIPSLLIGMNANIDSRKGEADGFISTPSKVDLNMEAGFSENGIEDWQMETQLWLGGYKSFSKATTQLADAWSHSLFIGPSVGMEYTSLGVDEDEDFYAVVNLLGLSVQSVWENQSIQFSVSADYFGDFAMVKPYATRDYHAQGRHFWGTKSVLWEGEYGYAWGSTLKLGLSLRIDDVRLGLNMRSHQWDSIDEKDQERIAVWNPNVNDVNFEDNRDRYQAYVAYLWSPSFGMGIHYELIDREGLISGIDKPEIYAFNQDQEQRTWIKFDFYY